LIDLLKIKNRNMLNSIPFLSNLIEKLIYDSNKNISKKSFIGFDGYIDKIQKVVKTRTKNEVVFYPTLKEFGERIVLAACKSGQVEIVSQEIKIGGNAPIMAYSLGALGVPNICLGNAGFCMEHILGYSLEESMILAMATSGAYVKNGESPNIPTLIEYLREWN
jgi:hypothetical protein